MEWHQDDILYNPTPQIEVILTISNTSDCITIWKEGEEMRNEIETKPNSVIILKAGQNIPFRL
jgi:dihydroorotase